MTAKAAAHATARTDAEHDPHHAGHHHPHAHHHSPDRGGPTASLLRMSALRRLSGVAVILALLWAAVMRVITL